MSSLEDNFYFVIYPKKIILKGIYYDSIMPHYSLSIFKGYCSFIQEISKKIRPQPYPSDSNNYIKLYLCCKKGNYNSTKPQIYTNASKEKS